MILLGIWLSCAPSTSDTGACGREPPLGYESFGAGVMSKHCTGCHSSYLPEGMRYDAPLGVDLNTYQGVLDQADRIYARTVESRDMPPGGGPSEEEIALLAEWLSCQVASDLARLEAGE